MFPHGTGASLAREGYSVESLRARHLSVWRLIGAVLLLGAAVIGVVWGIGGQSGSAASPRLVLTAPDEVAVGEPIEVRLTIEDANGISGFETTIEYDSEVVSLQSFDPTANDLADMGLAVEALGPVEVPGGIAIGAYACPFSDCSSTTGEKRNLQDGTGTYRLATLTFVSWQSGPLTLDLSSARFASMSGRPIEVDLSPAVVTVEVISNGEVE
jgi:hypothetical protein